MAYCDSSLIVASLTAEPLTDMARKFVIGLGDGVLVTSPWVGTEIASALAMKVRRGTLDDEQRRGLLASWRTVAEASRNEAVTPEDFREAETLVDIGLRAGDALHLAVVRRTGCAMATLDRDLADAAEAVGVEVALRPPA